MEEKVERNSRRKRVEWVMHKKPVLLALRGEGGSRRRSGGPGSERLPNREKPREKLWGVTLPANDRVSV